jgi:mono/diheme cytochrome c family protein
MHTVNPTRVVLVAAALFSCGDDDPVAGAGEPRDAAVPTRDGGRPSDDAGPWQPPTVVPPDPDAGEAFFLSQTGLYRDIAAKRPAPDLLEFEPTYKLWSDGADKQRWLRLPRGSAIDSADPDHWQFPVGTMVFKEFSHDGQRLETRLIMRTGPGERDYWMGAFVWDDHESDAEFVRDGSDDVRGTAHDVPSMKNCFTCHNGEPGRVLGFSAVQQPRVPAQLLRDPPAIAFTVPGDARTAAALGYLHANCGNCHNPRGTARPDTDMDLRLRVADTAPESTQTYITTLGVPMQYFQGAALTLRLDPGNPDQSGVLYRMLERGPKTQMPPIASELTDDDGVAAVRAWIEQL